MTVGNSLAADFARSLNPVYLAEQIGMEPDPWQADVLSSKHQQILLNCARQSGKSTVAAILAVHAAIYNPGGRILILSPTERQSKLLFQTCLDIYRKLGRPVPAEAENALSLVLENGSRIISLPGKADTVRGYADVRLLIIDEAAFVEDALMAAVRPMLAISNGRQIALSTPHGKRGWWWEAWAASDGAWKKVMVTADNCPRITAEWLEKERRTIGEWQVRQEYYGEFVEQADQIFGEEIVRKAFSREVEAIDFQM